MHRVSRRQKSSLETCWKQSVVVRGEEEEIWMVLTRSYGELETRSVCVCMWGRDQRSKVRGQTSRFIAKYQEQEDPGPGSWEVRAVQWISPPEASLRGKQSCLGHTWLPHYLAWISGAPDNMLRLSLRRGQACGSLPIPRPPNWTPTKNLLSFLKTRQVTIHLRGVVVGRNGW